MAGFALGYLQFPLFFHHPHWTLTSGVVHSFLAALAALSLVGIFYPLRMLPVLVYELLWKSIWLLGIALPLWLGNQFDPDTRQTFYESVGVVILIPIIPWRYFFRGPADPWRFDGRPKAIPGGGGIASKTMQGADRASLRSLRRGGTQGVEAARGNSRFCLNCADVCCERRESPAAMS